jgi:hypothetical protein
LKIKVECDKPKYAKGVYEYSSLEELFTFLNNIRGFAKSNLGSWLLCVAKDGAIHGVYTARIGIKVKSNFHDYELAQKIARKTGLVGAWDKVSPNPEIALAFAKAFDKEPN